MILFSCVSSVDYDIICNTELSEETETLYFEVDYGDIENFFEFEIYKHKYNVEISFDQEIIDSHVGPFTRYFKNPSTIRMPLEHFRIMLMKLLQVQKTFTMFS